MRKKIKRCRKKISNDSRRLEEKKWKICNKVIENKVFPQGFVSDMFAVEDIVDVCDDCRGHWFNSLEQAIEIEGIPFDVFKECFLT